ncbi:MAG: 23S rRNA (adenine(2503)-C(2))-methyltransferase RlmN [Pseudomonadota bacterium]
MSNGTANLLGMPRESLEQWFADRQQKPFRARQVMQWLHQRQELDIEQMTDLSKSLRAQLATDTAIALPRVINRFDSADGTVKWLLSAKSGQAIETVFIPEADRGTLCISSQVGCALDCAFCATAKQGFNSNLTSAEIIAQVWMAMRDLPRRDNGDTAVTNVVFMGMGEPLANYREVVPALQLLIDDLAYGLSRRRVTLSTSGLVPQIDKLAHDCNVSLAVSLHAPNDTLRDQLVPINRVHPIDQLLDACWRYVDAFGNRHITFEYVMLRGVNDQLQHADQLVELLRGQPAKVNLIPFNPFPGVAFERSSAGQIARFRDRLRDRGLVTTVRRTRGDDIDAACGQLAGKVEDRVKRSLGMRVREARAAQSD